MWNLVKFVKFGQNCEIWSELWDLVKIRKFGMVCYDGVLSSTMEVIQKTWRLYKVLNNLHIPQTTSNYPYITSMLPPDNLQFLFCPENTSKFLWHWTFCWCVRWCSTPRQHKSCKWCWSNMFMGVRRSKFATIPYLEAFFNVLCPPDPHDHIWLTPFGTFLLSWSSATTCY